MRRDSMQPPRQGEENQRGNICYKERPKRAAHNKTSRGWKCERRPKHFVARWAREVCWNRVEITSQSLTLPYSPFGFVAASCRWTTASCWSGIAEKYVGLFERTLALCLICPPKQALASATEWQSLVGLLRRISSAQKLAVPLPPQPSISGPTCNQTKPVITKWKNLAKEPDEAPWFYPKRGRHVCAQSRI